MSKQTFDLTHEPDLGYVFYPGETAEHPGHPRLDVIITAQPTERHFDPEKVRFHIVSPQGEISYLNVYHPWTLRHSYRICAGRLFLEDRKRKRVEAFSFGGGLQIISDKDKTVCILISEAPIIPLFTTHDLPMWLVEEVEILLAMQRSHWEPQHPHDFDAHLAKLDPFELYAACLQALRLKFSHPHQCEGHLELQGCHFVQSEIERLQQQARWPLVVAELEKLFQAKL